MTTAARLADWFLTVAERGNPATRLDARRGDGLAWSTGNLVRPLIHGASYFAELVARVPEMVAGDVLLFTDWRGDPDQLLSEGGHEVSGLFCAAARRGVMVRGLVWRSHLDRFRFSEQENRHLGEEIEAAGGQCLRDMRVRPGGSHHMKLVVLRHRGRPELDVAFIGGIDLCHSRRDDARHQGDPQHQPMAAVYGSRPPWHDVQAMITGPAVGDAEMVFRERWEDPAPLTRNPMHRLHDSVTRQDVSPRPLPPQGSDPPPRGTHAVQILRTYPHRKTGYSFAPDGERSIARAYLKALPRARRLVYLEDQYLWSATVVSALASALRDAPELRLIAIIPRFPDQDGKLSLPPNLVGRMEALSLLRKAAGSRVAVYGIENESGTPIYVHAKVCIVDDTWAIVGSDNFNRRSWSHDSELSCAVLDEVPAMAGAQAASPQAAGPQAAGPQAAGPQTAGQRAAGLAGQHAAGYAGALRLALSCEHLGIRPADVPADGHEMFDAFRRAAAGLDSWHAGGRRGELKWLGGVLGEARDNEVLAPYLRARLAEVPAEQVMGPVQARVSAYFAPRAASARAALMEALDSERYITLLNDLELALRDPLPGPKARQPAADVWPAAVRRAGRRVRRRARRAARSPAGRPRETALHETRKAAKDARYIAEAAGQAGRSKDRRVARRMKRLQSVLGDHHDAVVARDTARDIGVRAHRAGENAFSFGLLHERCQRDASLLEERAKAQWARRFGPAYGRWAR